MLKRRVPRNFPWGTPDSTGAGLVVSSSTSGSQYAVVVELTHETLMGNCVECPTEIQYANICLDFGIEYGEKVVHGDK